MELEKNRWESSVGRADTVKPQVTEGVELFAEDNGRVHVLIFLKGSTRRSMRSSGKVREGTAQR